MKTTLGHLVFSIDAKNIPFYRDLLNFLGWQVMYENEYMLGASSGECSLWFGQKQKDHANDYDGPGLNHFAIHTISIADVDATANYLKGLGVNGLFGTPRRHPDFSSDTQDYYQVMFETPDRILVEVCYTGPRATD